MIQVYSKNLTTAEGATFALSNTAIVKGDTAILSGSTIQLNRQGIYSVHVDASLEPTAAGLIDIQLYQDNIALPQAEASETGAAAEISNLSFSTLIRCPNNNTPCCFTAPINLTIVNNSESEVTGDINVVVTKIC